eukprot:gene61900-biopygen32543
MSVQSYLLEKPLCGIIPTEYGYFFVFACAVTMSGFFFTVIMLTMRIIEARPGIERIPASSLSIVATPAMIWGEWLCTNPVLLFLIIALEGKKDLKKVDYAIIVTPDIETGKLNSEILKRKQQKRFYLALWLTVLNQSFGATFILSGFKVIGPAETVGVFMLLTLLLQGFFAAVIANAH